MEKFSIPLEVRWSDIDANRHVRHSVYYDFGAYCRMMLFTHIGVSIDLLQTSSIGPVLLREEAVFRREIAFGDELTITAEVIKATDDFSRWSFRHNLVKKDGTVAAIITVDGGWIDLNKRKLTVPSEKLREAMTEIPKADDFQVQELIRK